MRISYLTVYGSMPGSINLELDGDIDMKFEFTEAEAAELRSVAMRIVERRQASLIKAASQPFIALADFTESN